MEHDGRLDVLDRRHWRLWRWLQCGTCVPPMGTAVRINLTRPDVVEAWCQFGHRWEIPNETLSHQTAPDR